MRLDLQLVMHGLCESREKAQRAIRAGQVRVNGHVADKPGWRLRPTDVLELTAGERYVSRGGLKLEHALHAFSLDVTDQCALDVGASTGGFTDCLLQHGAAHVTAVDVGRGQLAWKLRQDPRVHVLEGVNARQLCPSTFPGASAAFDLAVVNCSFISLRLVLPPIAALLRTGAPLITLIKPQFEAGRAEASRGRGVISDASIHDRVLVELRAFVGAQAGLEWRAQTVSPILGPAGNKEFFALLEKTS